MRLKHSLVLLFLLFTCIACDSLSTSSSKVINAESVLQGKTMGTSYNVTIIHPKNLNLDKRALQNDINVILKDLNQQVSTYISDSEISKFNQFKSTEWYSVNEDFYSTLESAQTISKESHGAYDATISPLVELWGFGVNNQKTTPDTNQLEAAKANIGYQRLHIDPEKKSIKKSIPTLAIDLSGIAKGFAVDKISEYLKNKQLFNHLVEIGGEIKASGLNKNNKKWRIAVEQPDLSSNSKPKLIEITNLAIATSGDYRNFFIEKGIRRSHIIDPKTAYPITHNLASVTVIHKSTMQADGYATAILVMGEQEGKAFANKYDLEVLMIIRDQDKFAIWTNSKLFK